MANSPQKRKHTEMGSEENVSTSRSGRIRKPKVFYDPSTVKFDAKRRSMPIMETAKVKKVVKLAEPVPLPKADKVLIQEMKNHKETQNAATINNRRQTICASSYSIIGDGGSGCIVCNRSDIKKGRFVNCIDCNNRGHFTCLRNDKLYKTADQEHNWQCPTCKICEHCNKFKPNDPLYKCIICLNSYHLQCSSKIAPLPKIVVKKKFTCGMCFKKFTTVKHTDVTKALIPNRKSDGFPGFAYDETTKIEPKITNIKVKKVVSIINPMNRTSSTKMVSVVRKLEGSLVPNMVIKQERRSITPEQEIVPDYKRQLNADENGVKTISVRKDLVQSAKLESDLENPQSNDNKMDVEYNAKTAITPDECIPDVRKWDCDEVYIYFMGKTTTEYAQLFKDNQIDGDALLLIKREDVLNRFNLKLGPALRLYSHIIQLQYKNNNPVLAWN